MTNIDNKELLLAAINDYDHFTKSQKAIVSIILNFEKEGMANISINSIIEMAGFSKTIVYKNLTKLEKNQIFKREKIANEKIGYIKLNNSKLDEILKVHLKKQQIIQNKLNR
jgi:predicted transcriptional regulator